MSTANAENLIKRTLALDVKLPEGFHQAAYELAKRSNSQSVMIKLAGRVDAPEALLEKYRKDTRPEVQVALLTRPGISEDELMSALRNEKRAGVLSGVIKNASNPKILAAVEETFFKNPTKALAVVLLAQGSAEAKLKAVQVLEENWLKLTNKQQAQCAQTVEETVAQEGGLEKVLAETKSGALVFNYLTREDNTKETQLELIRRSASWVLDEMAGWRAHYRKRELIEALRNTLNKYSDPDITEIVLNLRTANWGPETAPLFEDMLATQGIIYDPNAPEDLSTPEGRRSAASNTTSIQTLESLVEIAKVGKERDLAARLILNPSLTPRLLKGLLRAPGFNAAYTATHLSRAALNFKAKNELECVDMIYMKDMRGVLSKIGLEGYPSVPEGQERVLKTLLEFHSKNENAHLAKSLAFSLSALISLEGVDNERILSELPWKKVTGFSRSANHVGKLLVALANKQVELLGVNPAAWETFAVLAQDFEGTTGELLSVAATLTFTD